MDMTVHMLPARNGDCFLLDINQKYILIDGGYSDTYHHALKNLLPAKIDLAIVTHIDRDHIEGMIELFKYNGHEFTPGLITVNQVWYNSYSHLPKNIVKRELSQEEKSILREYIFPTINSVGVKEEPISGIQGMSLSYYLAANRLEWNSVTNGTSICVEHMSAFKLNEETTITLLTPSLEQLSSLAKYWGSELKQKKWTFDLTDDILLNGAMEAFLLSDLCQIDVLDAEISNSYKDVSIQELSALSATPDKSPTNASSISFLLQSNEKSLLFLSDAPEAQVIKAIKNLSIYYFDAIKLSHHGSLKNANTLFNYIDGEFYFISTDGSKHGHPDLSTLAKIIIRPCKKIRKLIFNYPNRAYHYFNNSSLMEQYNYTVQLSVDGDPICIT